MGVGVSVGMRVVVVVRYGLGGKRVDMGVVALLIWSSS